jgi:membrane protease YdiL (CAAX protease family)
VKVAKSYQRFLLKPSKIQFYASLLWGLSIFVLLVVLPILLWPKLIAIGAVMLLLVRIITLWRNRQHQELLFNRENDSWQLSGPQGWQELRLKSDQFVTARLVIIYFKTPKGSVIKRVITRDVMTTADHHKLRVLLLARSH